MADTMGEDLTDARILALFPDAGPVPTPAPGARAWVAREAADSRQMVLIKRITLSGGGKGRATASLALLHPGVVRTRRWLQEQGRLYVVRDVVRGRNLRQALAVTDAEHSPEALRRRLLPAIDALEFAHRQGTAHGGLSPENVLVTEDGTVTISDWATVDPGAPQHFKHYQGTASVAGDVAAMGQIVTEFLPVSGAFASTAVRDRIRGIISRCNTLDDLRETIKALEGLAAAPMPRPPAGGTPPAAKPVAATAPAAATEDDTAVANWQSDSKAPEGPEPRLVCMLAEKSARVMQGSGGTATLIVRNEGLGDLVLRMLATQHPWLNVQPIELPVTIPPGSYRSVVFGISAARLTPGEYRSEVYLSANASGKDAESQQGGWYRHTAEIRVTVSPTSTLLSGGNSAPSGKSPGTGTPPAPPGSGCLLALPTALLALMNRSISCRKQNLAL